jgi:hypothetical protein
VYQNTTIRIINVGGVSHNGTSPTIPLLMHVSPFGPRPLVYHLSWYSKFKKQACQQSSLTVLQHLPFRPVTACSLTLTEKQTEAAEDIWTEEGEVAGG